ncbi:hypothetical protein UFOVP97_38 [uncultured Caudovirales phage]|uniref:Uncharacterized protein n=1 Tax=uncultured Caudovirales phage TaxID=2100421 RepID=A0A6J5LJR1_9CAUD|nr:hypothetical protein UFOVP97_38 [uncultured Caudovirales phage]CAB4134415.1 hypothetical protein UFOVP268_56 [uncultured Caudovirales phage]
MRYAIIDPMLVAKNIINIVEWEGGEWLPPRGTHVLACPLANTGDTYNFTTREFEIHSVVNTD